MPFTRITLREGYSDAQLTQISDTLHQCLVEAFAVPPDDRFQVFETLPARQRVFDTHYKSAGRSDDFIQFHIFAGRPRSKTQKQNLFRLLSTRLHTQPGIQPDDVMVIIQFNTADEWSFSNGQMLSEENV
jgi:phenylpyruvate tautomerase PptA (4-oxalocrotonate tautomerase family)